MNDFNSDFFHIICGSYRRGLSLSSDIDLIICSINLITY